MTTTTVRAFETTARDVAEPRRAARVSARSLVAASAFFWSAWLFMPCAGVTDSQEIFDLITPHRGATLAGAVLQLVAATLFVPAMIGLIRATRLPFGARLWRPAAVFVVGLLGLTADAIDHMLGYAMTAPGIDQAEQIPTMEFMQGPGLLIIMPLITSFFVGGVWLSIEFARARAVSWANPALYAAAVAVGGVGALIAPHTALDGRIVGIATLGLVAVALAWLGAVVWRLRDS